MAETLHYDVKENGATQGDMVRVLKNVRDVLNELQTDAGTNKTLIDELKTDLTALIADVTAIRTAVVGITAKLDADGGVTDTDYASSLDPAALTVTAIAASSAAALTNSTAITLNAG